VSTLPISSLSPQSEYKVAKEEGWEEETKDTLVVPIAALRSIKGFGKWRGVLSYGVQLATQNADTKYLLGWPTATSFPMTNLSSASGFGSLTTLYGEVFLEKAVFRFIPVQTRGGAMVNVTVNFAQDSAVTFAPVQHGDASVTDGSTAWYTSSAFDGARTGTLAKPITFQWTNAEKLDWAGPLADHTTAAASTGWMEASSVATKLGGIVYAATANACHTTASQSLLPKNLGLGWVVVKFYVAARARIA
jgi:hypothetical protein